MNSALATNKHHARSLNLLLQARMQQLDKRKAVRATSNCAALASDCHVAAAQRAIFGGRVLLELESGTLGPSPHWVYLVLAS